MKMIALEDKELLLKDLCARLPYGVNVYVVDEAGYGHKRTIDGYLSDTFRVNGSEYEVDEIKPYLRPMSTMTDEEKKELKQVLEIELGYLASDEVGHTVKSAASSVFEIDFYNRNHFDYRGMIEKGLAFEAPKEMYHG